MAAVAAVAALVATRVIAMCIEDLIDEEVSMISTVRAKHMPAGRAWAIPSEDELWVCQLGTVEYREALALQERVRTARQADAIPDTLLLLEHPPVYTRGRRSAPGELPLGEDWYRARGIDIVDVDRGGS